MGAPCFASRQRIPNVHFTPLSEVVFNRTQPRRAERTQETHQQVTSGPSRDDHPHCDSLPSELAMQFGRRSVRAERIGAA
jgi:hypothetical protein